MLGPSWRRVSELGQFARDILGHAYVKMPMAMVVPVEFNPAIQASGPIRFDSVVFFKCGNEMFSVFISCVLDAKIIHHERENSCARAVLP